MYPAFLLLITTRQSDKVGEASFRAQKLQTSRKKGGQAYAR